MATKIITHENDAQAKAASAAAGRALRKGKLVAFATETVYGVAALATDTGAMERLRELKSRPENPFSVHLPGPQDVSRYVASVSAPARRLISRAWPGPITLILPVGRRFPDADLHVPGLHAALCRNARIGLRCPKAAVTQAALVAARGPVVASSANLSGHPSPRSAREVLRQLDGKIDLLVDSGKCRYGKDSTIVRFDGSRWELLREGVCGERTVAELLTLKILFICTGNTCRSPMAEGIAKALFAGHLGCIPDELPGRGYDISSAGVFGGSESAAPEAIAAAAEYGADLSTHRSRRMTGKLASEADILFCMSSSHVSALRQISRACADRAVLLDATGSIPDPIGGGSGVYRQTAKRIHKALRARLKEELQ